jgi:glycosyltransferase involved in cell wall biosynthesis
MHICFILTRGDSIGGAQVHVRDLSIALKGDGHRVSVIVGSSGDFTKQLEETGIDYTIEPAMVRQISPIKDIGAILSLKKLIAKLQPDIVSTHTAKAGMVGRIASYLSRVPVLFTAHGWQFASGVPKAQALFVLFIERLIGWKSSRIITVSNYDYGLAVSRRAVPEKLLTTVHNGLPWRDAPARESASSGMCRLIMVARFQEQKDHYTLLCALSGIDTKLWTLTLVGGGPLLEETKKHASELGIEKEITFVGQSLDVPSLLDQSDVYLLITNWEGFPRSIVEAMRASLPVIVSDVGGCNEAVVEGETGFLIPQGDVDQLRERISTLISSPEIRHGMGMAGRNRYEQLFTFDEMYKKTVQIYKESIKNGKV